MAILFLFPLTNPTPAQALETLTHRPPNQESTPKELSAPFTPNDKFFVRYHLSAIPKLDAKKWKLELSGEAFEKSISFTLEDLKKNFEHVEITAITYCAGNQRGLFKNRVPGVQWKYGAMGNAKWKGVRLKDVLQKARIKKDAVEFVFNGADMPVFEKTPDFIKSLPISKAMDENTIIAFQMNGKPLPQNQGFPARLIVPGWTATYWMKHLISIKAVAKPHDGFWMNTAYRIPKGKFPEKDSFKSQETKENTPVTRLVVNSIISSVQDGQKFKTGKKHTIEGKAWDGGSGIKTVETSVDGGKTWIQAELGPNYGVYSWRPFHFSFQPHAPGEYILMAKATAQDGATQVFEEIPNPAGYHRNVTQKVKVKAILK